MLIEQYQQVLAVILGKFGGKIEVSFEDIEKHTIKDYEEIKFIIDTDYVERKQIIRTVKKDKTEFKKNS